MERQVQITTDGSATICIPAMDVTYHSRHGAVTESLHVFIKAGLDYFHCTHAGVKEIRVFEMGLGTGLNALLTAHYAAANNVKVYYETVEQYPLTAGEIAALNYNHVIDDSQDIFSSLHAAPWNIEMQVNEWFTLKKMSTSLQEHAATALFHVIYYDAFAPAAQPELWTEDIFHTLHSWLQPGGVLVTYCARGAVKRAMQSAGFSIEKLPGPPGKREMIRATR